MLPHGNGRESVSRMTIPVIAVIVGFAALATPALCGVDEATASEPTVLTESVSFEVIEAALEHPDWEKLATMLAPSPEAESLSCDREPRLRFLAGHTFLATSRNNEATLCFACADDTASSATLKDWQMWTKDLVRQHPTWPSVRYLYADALARLGLFEEAAFELDQVLAISPQDYLARNARGVVYWLLGAGDSTRVSLQDLAITDFQVATQRSGFADPWANLGVLDLYQGYDPKNARGNFEQALSSDSSFALAVNGRACAWGESGNLKEARKDISRAKRLCSVVGFVAANAAAMSRSADTTSAAGGLARQQATTRHRGAWLEGRHSFEIGFKTPWLHGSWKHTPDPRGGIYVQLREGENLLVDREGNPRVIGTWFVLNYPLVKSQTTRQGSETE